VRRTGSLALDREVVRVIQRASPFPRIPGLSGNQTVTIRTPVPVVPR
jgi:TonB family protein